MTKIGCLALQGAVEPHRAHIEAAGAEFLAVKTAQQFDQVDALILPGGESTTMLKLIDRFNLWDALKDQFETKPVWGICAGTILIAQTVLVLPKTSSRAKSRDPSTPRCSGRDDAVWDTQKSFGILPMTVQRNGYGRQLDSHHAKIDGYEVSFIRAPVITKIDGSIDVLAEHEGAPVWVQKGNKIASTFHPELTLDTPSPMHKKFVDLMKIKN